MDRAIRVLVDQVGIAPGRAFAMATSEPARVAGLPDQYGALREGRRADPVLLDDAWGLRSVWTAGQQVTRG